MVNIGLMAVKRSDNTQQRLDINLQQKNQFHQNSPEGRFSQILGHIIFVRMVILHTGSAMNHKRLLCSPSGTIYLLQGHLSKCFLHGVPLCEYVCVRVVVGGG